MKYTCPENCGYSTKSEIQFSKHLVDAHAVRPHQVPRILARIEKQTSRLGSAPKGRGSRMNRKPSLTVKILRGIVAATSVILAGDIASAFGQENEQTRENWGAVSAADYWAKRMIAHKEQKQKLRTRGKG